MKTFKEILNETNVPTGSFKEFKTIKDGIKRNSLLSGKKIIIHVAGDDLIGITFDRFNRKYIFSFREKEKYFTDIEKLIKFINKV